MRKRVGQKLPNQRKKTEASREKGERVGEWGEEREEISQPEEEKGGKERG